MVGGHPVGTASVLLLMMSGSTGLSSCSPAVDETSGFGMRQRSVLLDDAALEISGNCTRSVEVGGGGAHTVWTLLVMMIGVSVCCTESEVGDGGSDGPKSIISSVDAELEGETGHASARPFLACAAAILASIVLASILGWEDAVLSGRLSVTSLTGVPDALREAAAMLCLDDGKTLRL